MTREMTQRLYYHDSYLRAFTAEIVETHDGGSVVYLDRTAFYPTSGGQPFDTGSINGVEVLEITDEEAVVAHRLATPLPPGTAECLLNWPRRFDHMQQHTGQHLLSAVLAEQFGWPTVSFHLGAESSTIDLEGAVTAEAVRQAEWRANQIVCENRPVSIAFEPADQATGLRKASERDGTLRIVSIQDLDRSACGGTHVRATGEIGAILIRKLDRVRQTVRLEFVCGGRAVRRARADYDTLDQVARLFSAPPGETPSLVAAQLEAARAAEKLRRKLELDLAAYEGKQLYDAAAPGPDGFRRHTRRLPAGAVENLRTLAQSFTAQPRAVFTVVLENPPSILYATSADSGIDAGQILKAAVAAVGGRGGGAARLAQGSVPDPGLLTEVLQRLGAGQ